MRGAFEDQGGLFSYILPEARVPAGHPLHEIRARWFLNLDATDPINQ